MDTIISRRCEIFRGDTTDSRLKFLKKSALLTQNQFRRLNAQINHYFIIIKFSSYFIRHCSEMIICILGPFEATPKHYFTELIKRNG